MTSIEIPSHRACAHCRSQKVRCIPSEGNVDVCERCARTGKPCVFTPLQKRKQRKRTDTRVAELEREMRAMRTALRQKEDAGTATSASPDPEDGRAQSTNIWAQDGPSNRRSRLVDLAVIEEANLNKNVGESGAARTTSQINGSMGGPLLWPIIAKQQRPPSTTGDVIDRGLISLETARRLFETYRNELFPLYPMVPIPASTSADDMRREQPALFLAIIAAAAGQDSTELSALLDEEVLQAYATRSLVQSEKSLELVQALLISSMWYHPPQKFGQLKYYEYVHMAATMAMDLGIGMRPLNRRRGQSERHGKVRLSVLRTPEELKQPAFNISASEHLQTDSIECRRTFLACYFICAGVSLSLRRPNMLRVSSYIRECVTFLDQSPDALPTDCVIVAWVQLIIIGEEISSSFCYDDPGGIASIAEMRTQFMLKDFQRRLSEWYGSVSDTDPGSGTLGIMYYTVRLYLHEVALHVDHAPEDFCAPYQMGPVQNHPEADQVPSQVLAETVAECISSSHGLLDVFLKIVGYDLSHRMVVRSRGCGPRSSALREGSRSFHAMVTGIATNKSEITTADTESLRAVPVFTFVRVSFATFFLAKLSQSASTPGSRIGQVLDHSALKVEAYMDRLILHVGDVVGSRRCRVPAIFLALLFKLRQWCLHPEMIGEAGHNEPVYSASDSPYVGRPRTSQIEGPRLIEAVSSADSSPHRDSGNSRDLSENGNPTSEASLPITTVTSNYGNMWAASGGIMPTNVTPASFMPTLPLAPPDPNQMQLDSQYLQMLNEMNAFTEGGLTGLDDWAAQPDDFMAMMDSSDWPQQAPLQPLGMNNGGGL